MGQIVWKSKEESDREREEALNTPSETEVLKAENAELKRKMEAVSVDLQGFMDFYFSNL